MIITIISALITVILSIITVKYYGIIGIASSSAIGMIVWNVVTIFYQIKVLHIKSYFSFNPKIILNSYMNNNKTI